MHIEHALLKEKYDADMSDKDATWLCEGRMYSWMDAGRMKEVGVTAGVKRVITAVKGGLDGAMKRQGTKRKKRVEARKGRHKKEREEEESLHHPSIL